MYWTDWDRISEDEARHRQGRVLHDFLKNQVLKYSPFYIELFKRAGLSADNIKSLDDLHKIPFTTKADIAPTAEDPAKPRKLVLQPDPDKYASTIGIGKKLGLMKNKLVQGRELRDQVLDEYLPIFFISTTGRTALPTPFMYTTRDLQLFNEAARRLLTIIGAKRDKDFIISIFPYAPHLAFWIVYQAGIMNGCQMFHTGGGRVLGTEKIMKMIESFKATIVVGIPGYVYHLLTLAAEQKLDYSHVRMIVLGAERVTPGYKKRIAELLESMGAKNPIILSTLGFTEARVAWTECPTENSIEQSTGYHLYPDLEIFEVIDPETGKPVGKGESGELAYTCLDWRGSVVLRYRTGDYIRGGITREPCPSCGRTCPRMSCDITRLCDKGELQLTKVKGTLVDFNEFFPIMSDQKEVREWQIEIGKRHGDEHGLDEITLNLSLKEGADGEAVVNQIDKVVKERMEVSIEKFNLLSPAEISSLLEIEVRPKELRIKDKRKEK
ncbi:MAG: AMP-binding protein [bacterium]|nr:AMP-binding protein [bacterium]